MGDENQVNQIPDDLIYPVACPHCKRRDLSSNKTETLRTLVNDAGLSLGQAMDAVGFTARKRWCCRMIIMGQVRPQTSQMDKDLIRGIKGINIDNKQQQQPIQYQQPFDPFKPTQEIKQTEEETSGIYLTDETGKLVLEEVGVLDSKPVYIKVLKTRTYTT